MPAPFSSDVYVPAPLTDAERKRRRASIEKLAAPMPLYVYRQVLNAGPILEWAKAQGIQNLYAADDLHVTIAYSKTPVDWMAMGDNWSMDRDGNYTVEPGGPRLVQGLGPEEKTASICFASSMLSYRHESIREKGASWDWSEYQPHIAVSKEPGVDLASVEPYRGEIVLGPEIFEAIDDSWSATVEKRGELTICKVSGIDEELGLVFGWSIVCKVDGEDYYDLNIDADGTRVPEHITEPAMLKGAAGFMLSERVGNEMHAGPDSGTYVFAFPLTTEIAKAMGIQTRKTGLMVAYKPEPAVLAKFKSGEYGGFSIEGSRLKSEEHSA